MSETDEANVKLQNTPREVNLQSSQQVRVQKLMKQMRSFTIQYSRKSIFNLLSTYYAATRSDGANAKLQ
jgi:hypothetical protein